MLRAEITKSHLNSRICQHCGVKTSTVTPSFYYVFHISLSCNINMPSFIGNLWRVLLLGNHLNLHIDRATKTRDDKQLYLGPVHTNPFYKICVHTYRFRPSTPQRRICLKTLLYPQCEWSNELDACAFQYIGPRNWREIEATW